MVSPCETTCVGTCLSCALEGTAGTCTPVAEGMDPDRECAGGFCSGSGRCAVGDGGVLLDAAVYTDAGPVDAPMARDAHFEVPDAALPTGRASCSSCSASNGQSQRAMWALGAVGMLMLVKRRRTR